MKLLFDQNLSPKLARALQDIFPSSAHVREFNLREADDWEIWNYAAAGGYAVVTQDADFQKRSLVQGHPPKVVWITVGNSPSSRMEQLIRGHHRALSAFDADPQLSIIELS